MLRLLLATLLILAGCGSDDSVTDPGPGARDFPLPLVVDAGAGRDQAIDNLERAYTELRYIEYDHLIGSDFVFRADPVEVSSNGFTELSAAQDLESTQAMFSGETGIERVLDMSGNWTGETMPVPAVQTVQLVLRAAATSQWEQVTLGEFAGTWRKTYDLDMAVAYSGPTSVDQVIGRQSFYLLAESPRGDGEPVWVLRAWEDHGVSSRAAVAGQAASFGSIKAQFVR
ncbi:hypothetical protein DRQ53_08215 [bacterium]|nr:MAG: hypothetical protein DRQ53_08215 [bacterium]